MPLTPPQPSEDASTADAPPARDGGGAHVPTVHGSVEQPGDFIGPYKLLSVIGEGGFGTVWLAERREPIVQRVALKVIKAGMDTKAVIARFEQERQALAVMDHPNVARVFDAGATPTGRPYFVMEHVPGEPITEYADRQNLSVRHRLELFICVCEAVQHAHHKGIIHRDIKPSNILVAVHDGAAIPKIIDFGVAKAISHTLTDKTIFTETGQLIGTREYMSPEQAEMGATDIDTRTDVYSLGVVLYELLSGLLPFDAKMLRAAGDDAIRRILREQDAPKPSTRLSSVDPATGAAIAQHRVDEREHLARELRRELDWIPLKALRKDRTARYGTPADLARDIRCYLDGQPLEAGPESAAYRVRKFVRRNRGPVVAGCAVLAALLLGLGATLWMAREAAEQAARADERAEAASAAMKVAESKTVEAEAERARLKLGLDFLADVFGNLESSTALHAGSLEGTPTDRKPDLGQVLALASTQAQHKFADDPEVQGRVRHVLGNIYDSIGETERAVGELGAASSLLTEALGLTHEEAIIAANDLAIVLRTAGKRQEAQSILQRIIPLASTAFGPEHPETATMMNNLGDVAFALGDYAGAEKAFADSLRIREKQQGYSSPAALNSRMNLASVYAMTGRLDEAREVQRAVLAERQRTLGADDRSVLAAMDALGTTEFRFGEVAAASELFEQSLARRERTLGRGHIETLRTASNLGLVRQKQGRISEARELLQRAADGLTEAHDPDHPEAITAVNNLAVLLLETGQSAAALPLLEKGLAASRKNVGNDHLDTLIGMTNLARAYQNLERWEDARRISEEALGIARQSLNANDPTLLGIINNFGFLCYAEGRHEQALALFQEAAAGRQQVFGVGSATALTTSRNVAATLFGLGRFAEAETLLTESLPAARTAFANNPSQMSRSLTWRARALQAQRKFAAAEADLTEALALFKTEDASVANERQAVRAFLHALYVAWGRADKAAEFVPPPSASDSHPEEK